MTGYRHGFASAVDRNPTYRSWECAKSRCRNPNNPDYAGYGGRGIVFSAEWDLFPAFLHDLGHRPRGTTLDRIDSNGNYEPGNCKWSTPSEQQRNKRSNRRLEYHGQVLTIADLARLTAIPYQRLHERIIRRGWEAERAVNEPVRCW